jgi:arginine repressor
MTTTQSKLARNLRELEVQRKRLQLKTAEHRLNIERSKNWRNVKGR